MDKEHVKGAADKAKGAIKDTAGKMTGDKSLQAEGKMDKAKGAAHQAAGDIKDSARRARSPDQSRTRRGRLGGRPPQTKRPRRRHVARGLSLGFSG